MTSFVVFDSKVQELRDAIFLANDLENDIKKTIKEVFRNAGYHCKEIRLQEDGFSCIGGFSEIGFDDLKKIQDFFEDYHMSVYFHNTYMAFKFTQKS